MQDIANYFSKAESSIQNLYTLICCADQLVKKEFMTETDLNYSNLQTNIHLSNDHVKVWQATQSVYFLGEFSLSIYCF